MKCLLSIFSFKTLRLSFNLPRAVILGLCLVALSEGMARYIVHKGILNETPSLKKTIRENTVSLNQKRPSLWLIGNSTLRFGINLKYLETQLGSSAIKLCHGGATVRGSAAMLDFYANKIQYQPARVILFITKDDLNPNGLGAKTSKTYLQYLTLRKYFKPYSVPTAFLLSCI